MRICLLLTGKTQPEYIRDGCSIYEKRLSHYTKLEFRYIPEVRLTKTMTSSQLKDAESAIFMKNVKTEDFLVILDENGKSFTSVELAGFLHTTLLSGKKEMIIAIGGAHGFNQQFKKRANTIMSLSSLTFPHQLTRLIFLEQLYRSFTIIRNEPYHHS